MHKVYDIRGTHGSGKSTIPHTILEKNFHETLMGLPLTYPGRVGVLGYYVPDLNLYIIGKYASQCGGCDAIKTQDEIKARVDYYRAKGNVLLEGILVAHTFGPWLDFSRGRNWRFCILNTPLDECIRRVNARRAIRGREPIENTSNIVRDHGRITAMVDKFTNAGAVVHVISDFHDFMAVYNDERYTP